MARNQPKRGNNFAITGRKWAKMVENWFRLGLIMRVISLEDRKNGFGKAKNNFNT